jgi:Holliday junction resolvase YEN1
VTCDQPRLQAEVTVLSTATVMGVPGLWDVSQIEFSVENQLNNSQLLRPAGQPRSLTHLAVVDGFQANRSGYRGFRVGIDASIWFFHAAYGREGENPELRTMFFRCSRLLGMPFLPLFVFDGPKRPSIKRNKRVSGNAHWLTNGMKNIIEAFGFEWKTVRLVALT